MVGGERGLVFPLGRGRQVALLLASLAVTAASIVLAATSASSSACSARSCSGASRCSRPCGLARPRGLALTPTRIVALGFGQGEVAWDDVRAVGTLQQGPVQLIGIEAVNVRRGAFGRFNRRFLPPTSRFRPPTSTRWCARSSPTWTSRSAGPSSGGRADQARPPLPPQRPASVNVFVLRSPPKRRSSVALTARRPAFSARPAALDGFSVTVRVPAPAQRTVPRASVVDFSRRPRAVLAETFSVAVPVIARVQVTRTASPRAAKPAAVVRPRRRRRTTPAARARPPTASARRSPPRAVTTTCTVAVADAPPGSVTVIVAS